MQELVLCDDLEGGNKGTFKVNRFLFFFQFKMLLFHSLKPTEMLCIVL